MKPNAGMKVASHVLQWALAMMPRGRAPWVQAMASEFDALPGTKDRIAFALGCLVAAASELIRTRRALAWIGRALVAFGLICMSAYGFLLTSRLGEHGVASILLTLSSMYALAAIIALFSLRALRYYAGAGLIAAAVGCVWFAMSPAPHLGLSARFLTALSFEAGMIMGALLVAAAYLSLVDSPNGDTSEHA